MAASDWIDWNGGEQPVPDGTLVEVRWADSDRPTKEAVPAECWSSMPYEWSITAEDNQPGIQIVAYRVVEAA